MDTHPVVYSAWGSHGHWIDAGGHVYDEVCFIPGIGPCDDLVDECGEGTAWDTWNKMVPFEFDPVTRSGRGLQGNAWPTWMSEAFTEPGDFGDPSDPSCGAIYRWGNPEWGSVFGYYRLVDGPTGPISKGVMTSETLQ
ncbi:MAG: hypothetical protein JW932_02865 [Deltaproteobacteria bacterium]|nr:hypothetical protein [Deltaproteobacteria bacterium]